MENIGFEVKLNGKTLYRAGFVDDYYVLSCTATSVSRDGDEEKEVYLNISGLNSVLNRHVKWANIDLKEGDEINIKLITNNFDLPSHIVEQDPEEFIIQSKIKYFKKLKEELKEYLDEEL
jgi:hypothetical protein